MSISATQQQSLPPVPEKQTRRTQQETPDVSGGLSAPNPESKALWTNGQPDAHAIKKRMEETLQAYLQKRPPPLDRTPYRFLNQLSIMKKAQAQFYSDMHYLDDLLHAIPELPLQVASTTTIVPYQPANRRRRGRPATGRNPRASRRNTDNDPY